MSTRRRSFAVGGRPEAKVVRALIELREAEANDAAAGVLEAIIVLRETLDELDEQALADLAWYFGEIKLAQARGDS